MAAKGEFREVLSGQLAAIFVAIGAVIGLAGGAIFEGAIAGALLYLIVVGVGWLCTLLPD